MKRFLLIVFLAGLTSVLSASDVYVRTKATTSAFEIMGQKQPEQEMIFEQWMTEKGMAAIMPNGRVIVDTEKNLFFMIDDDEKTYLETPLPLDMTKIMPPEMVGMMSMMKPSVKISPTGKTKKIGAWNCSGYDVSIDMAMMQMKQTVWASTEVPFDWQKFSEMNAHITKLQGQFLDEAAINELLKIKGVPIASETALNVMGADMKTVTEVTDITEKKAPANMFVVPEGYRKITHLSPEQLQK